MTDVPSRSTIVGLTVKIVAAHVSNNDVDAENLPTLLTDVHQSLSALGSEATAPEKLVPAVAIRNSVTPDYIVCLEDGRRLKMLKRHLQTAYGMTPEQYRERWNLSPDYPMVAPNYAARRSELAKRIGLGRHGRNND